MGIVTEPYLAWRRDLFGTRRVTGRGLAPPRWFYNSYRRSGFLPARRPSWIERRLAVAHGTVEFTWAGEVQFAKFKDNAERVKGARFGIHYSSGLPLS